VRLVLTSKESVFPHQGHVAQQKKDGHQLKAVPVFLMLLTLRLVASLMIA
jgi:hypothetical protein